MTGSKNGNAHWRVALVLGSAALLLIIAALTFWYQDLRYSLPTPRPTDLQEVRQGQVLSLPSSFTDTARDGRPLLFHFFNPDCPCSRFNADHLRTLRQRFGTQVRFVAVMQVEDGRHDRGLEIARRLFGSEMEMIVDEDGRIATACGVYSTPQAALLSGGSDRTLLFRGNYNTARYCTDPQAEFVRLALEALVDRKPLPPPVQAAMVAYGCELPINVAATKRFSLAGPPIKR